MVYHHTVIPFHVDIQSGKPVYEQVLLAVRKAALRGQLSPGDQFPSVRALSVELKINPSTAQKVVAALIEEGLLEARPGLGTFVRTPNAKAQAPEEREQLLKAEIEKLVVDAKRLGLGKTALVSAILKQWQNLS